ncbi:MAG TPA: hypothetical protein VG796_30610 [Verrucomicrobiales bacterium]|jgi:hypothetical protein|nr:hypothetical protein [Verrucomicrobiales bacterium]
MNGNPFAADIYPDGTPPEKGAAVLHANAVRDLQRLVEHAGKRAQTGSGAEGGGTVVLLRAPRAGFGKSHLLARVAAELRDRAFVVPVTFDREREVQWSAVLWQILETFHQGRARDLSLLDLVTRRIFAILNQRMIIEKQVPCAHPKEALEALEQRFVELFDFANASQPVARWFTENFERLVPFASRATSQITGISPEASTHWLRVLCAYAQGRVDGETVRWESLRWSVLEPSGPAISQGGMNLVSAGSTGEAGARERLVEFCRLAAGVRPLVLVFDDLDLFHQLPEPVQRIAGVITELRRLLSRAVQVLSVNQDLWAQTFLKALPSAIEDRLTGNQITLGTTNRDEAAQIIRSRLVHTGYSEVVISAFFHRLNLSAYFSQEAGRLVSPRALLRHAALVWEDFEQSAAAHAAAAATPAAPIPEIPDIPSAPTVPMKVADAGMYRTSPPKPEEEQEGEPAGDPAFARLRDTLQRLLTPMRAEEPLTPQAPFVPQFEKPVSSGVILADPAPAENAEYRRPASTVATLSPDAILQRRFQQLRSHFLTAPWLAVDQERLFHLLKIAGRRLAVVKWVDHPLPGSPGQSAGAWMGPDGETIFGSEPYEDRTYWSSLVHFVRERSGFGFSAPALKGVLCRLVVFSAAKAPVNLSSWMPQDEIIDARTHFLDVQSVDQPLLATLYAADEMMRDADRGTLGVSHDETFAMLMPHLEFLWRQITRPVKPSLH